MISKRQIHTLSDKLSLLPSKWNGKDAILEMKSAGYPHWKQMEWIGFYFQFLCDRELSSVMKTPGPRFGNADFDGFWKIPWDFKAHPKMNASGKENNTLIVNDKESMREGVKKFGAVGLILANGLAEYNDIDRSFQFWHKELKGGLSKFEKDRITREAPSRLRKTAFCVEEIELCIIDEILLEKLSSFQEGFRNSNGRPRRAKFSLHVDKLKPVKTINFSN